MHHILISELDSAGEIRLTKSRYLLGRSKNCDIRIASPAASRVHAYLFKDQEKVGGKLQDRFYIADGDPETGKPSTSGTYLWNEENQKWEKRKAAALKHGDRIMFAPEAIYRYLCMGYDTPCGEPNCTESDSGATWA